jgi:two-component system, chemotaxis family, chemotaxis protein CheY
LSNVDKVVGRGEALRVLIVDDDGAIRQLLKSVLEGEGFGVDEAINGADAMDRLQDTQPDAILLDLMMPVMDGWTFLDKCRALRTDIPVVVMSASHDFPQGPQVRASFRKPFDLDEVLRAVDSAIAA